MGLRQPGGGVYPAGQGAGLAPSAGRRESQQSISQRGEGCCFENVRMSLKCLVPLRAWSPGRKRLGGGKMGGAAFRFIALVLPPAMVCVGRGRSRRSWHVHRNKVPICSKGSNSSVSPPPSPKKPTTTEHPPLRRRVGQSSHAQNPPPPQACPPRWRWRRQMGHIVFLPWPMPTGWSYRGREHWAGGCCVLPISCPSPAMHRSPQRGGGGVFTTTAEWGLLAQSETQAA